MNSEAVLRGLSVASYLATIILSIFLYNGTLTAWPFVVLIIFIWGILAAVIMQRASKHAERETAQKIFQILNQETQNKKSKDVQDLLNQMRSKFPHGGQSVN
jgi:flagellar motor component MotA